MTAPRTDAEPPAIVGIAPCGCLHGAVVDDPSNKRDTATFVARMIQQGLRIETWTCQAVRETKQWGCSACRPKRKPRKVSAQTVMTL